MTSGDAAGSVLPVAAEPLLIGRDSLPDGLAGALASDLELSRRHANVWDAAGAPMIEDLGSSNGTFVNGRRIDGPTALHQGDTIRVGTTTMTVECEADHGATVLHGVDPEVTRVRQVPAVPSPPPTPPPAPPSAGASPPSAPPVPARSGLLGRLASLSERHPGRILGAVGVFFVISVVFGAPVAGMLHADDPFNDHSSQSIVVKNQIAKATGELPGAQVIALVTPPGGVSAPGTRAIVENVAAELRADPTVTRTLSYYNTGSRSFLARNGSSTYVAAFFKNVSENDANNAAKRLLERVQKAPTVLLGGPAVAGQQLGSEVGKDLGKAEGLAFPILFILSLFVFRGVVAALMPLFVGGVTVVSTFLVLRIVNSFLSLSQFALNVVIGLGLGLAIDYSLFVVSRYREELAKGGTEREALHRAVGTAGRTITYSAVTVALALASLCVIPMPFLISMGLGGAITALVAVTVALVALPAMLAVLGPRINSLSPARWRRAAERTASQQQEGPWYRLSQAVMRRPVPIATACVVVLLVLGIPFTGIKFIGVDASGVPKGMSARTVDDALVSGYSSDASSQITALVKAPASAGTQVAALAAQVRGLPGALPAGGPATSLRGGYWTFAVLPAQRPLAASTITLVKDIKRIATRRSRRAARPRSSSTEIDDLWVATGGRDHPLRAHRDRPIPDDRVGGPPTQVVADELPVVERSLRDPRVHLPRRAPAGPARLPKPARDRHLPADPDLRDRVRSRERLHRVLADTHQGSAGCRTPEQGGGRDRPRAHRPDRDPGGAAVLCGDRRLRDLLDRVHQGGRGRDRRRGDHRRDDHSRAARALADGATWRTQLVGSGSAAPAASAHRVERGVLAAMSRYPIELLQALR